MDTIAEQVKMWNSFIEDDDYMVTALDDESLKYDVGLFIGDYIELYPDGWLFYRTIREGEMKVDPQDVPLFLSGLKLFSVKSINYPHIEQLERVAR